MTAFPNILVSPIFLTAAYVELGREEDARTEAAEIMRMSPQFTVASLLPGKDVAEQKLVRDICAKRA